MQETMKLYLFLTFVFYLCASLAAPQGRPRQDGGSIGQFVFPEWSITNFDGRCSPGGCLVFFNMGSAETATEPGVSARCDINGGTPVWQECSALPGNTEETNGSVWALPISAYDTFAVSLQHRFVNDSITPFLYWNVTGNMSVNYEQTTMPVNLTVHPLSVSESWSWG